MNERELIRYLDKTLPRPPNTLSWMNEDCEIIELPKNENDLLLVNVDTSTENVDFPIDAPDEEIGYFCTSLSISDVAACGGEPVGVLVSCCVSKLFEGRILGIYEGIKLAASDANTYILGGDTNSSDEFSLSIVTVGRVDRDRVLRRGRAKIGDIIGVTGDLSKFNDGFYDYRTKREIIDYKHMFHQQPPTQKGIILSSLGYVTSCIDLPDGLVKALDDNKGIGYGYLIYDAQIPIDTKRQFHLQNQHHFERASYPAGDIELLFTIPPDRKDDAIARFDEAGMNLYFIGEVIPNPGIHINVENQIIQPTASGFVHEFGSKKLFA